MKKKLSEMLRDCQRSALQELKCARARKHPRYRPGIKYWEGMAQAYANAATLASGWEQARRRRDRTQLSEAREALEWYAEFDCEGTAGDEGPMNLGDKARATLAKLEGEP